MIKEQAKVGGTGRMSVSVTPDMQKKLDSIAESQDRSRSWLVNQAINQYLEFYEWQTEKIQKRLDIATGKNAKFYSSDEVNKIVEKFKA